MDHLYLTNLYSIPIDYTGWIITILLDSLRFHFTLAVGRKCLRGTFDARQSGLFPLLVRHSLYGQISVEKGYQYALIVKNDSLFYVNLSN